MKKYNLKKTNIVSNLLCLVICVIAMLPFMWMIATSLRLPVDSFRLPPSFFSYGVSLSELCRSISEGAIALLYWQQLFGIRRSYISAVHCHLYGILCFCETEF